MRAQSLALALVAAAAFGAACNPSLPPDPARPRQLPAAPGAAPGLLPESASRVGFERMARFPEPGWQVPRLLKFSPDAKLLTFLQSPSQNDEMALFSLDLASGRSRVLLAEADLASGAAKVSLAEELRNERQRKRTKGITDYHWAERADALLVPARGDVFVRTASGTVTQLTATADPEIDPKLCPDGSRVAFARGRELFVVEVATKKETQLTSGAPEGVTRGQSDFVAQEEFDEPSGHLWSGDCKRIAYLEVDERAVEEVPVLGYRGGAPQLMMQRYPRAGKKNPKVSVLVVDVATKKTVRVEPPPIVGEGSYLARFRFTSDGTTLAFWALARSQRELALVVADLDPVPKARVAYRETKPAGWIEMPDLVLANDGATAFAALEHEGFAHLAAIPLAGKDAGARFVTKGAWNVAKVFGVDAEGRAYVSANKDETLGRSLYRVDPVSGAIGRVTPEKGVHDVVVAAAHGLVADVHSAADRPPRAVVLGAKAPVEIPLPKDDETAALGLRVPEIVQARASDGTTLYGALLRPRVIEPGKKYPLLVVVYGGPGVQTVLDRWSPRLLWQHLADRGMFVVQFDNRGTGGRGPGFAAPIAGKLGAVELDDQIAALDQLLAREPIDPARVGIYGHSYGGFMAALAMLKAPGKFRVGIAASPVTDWRLYDTGYTERYMSTPAENQAGYAASDLELLAGNLRGRLLVVHALMDENVHFQHTADLVDALIKAKKPFDMFVFPGERHGYRSPEAREFAMGLVTRYLAGALGGEPPEN